MLTCGAACFDVLYSVAPCDICSTFPAQAAEKCDSRIPGFCGYFPVLAVVDCCQADVSSFLFPFTWVAALAPGENPISAAQSCEKLSYPTWAEQVENPKEEQIDAPLRDDRAGNQNCILRRSWTVGGWSDGRETRTAEV